MPKISVLVPVYNGEKYLRDALNSVLGQTFYDFELIVVNDGSRDRTSDILNSYSDPRIRVINNSRNLGISASLNAGLEAARCEYIARFDADDIAHPDRLERQLATMNSDETVGLCFSDFIVIDTEGKTIGASSQTDERVPFEWLLLWDNPIPHPTVMLRKKVLSLGNFRYDGSLEPADDYDLWTRLIGVTRFRKLNENLISYRRNPFGAYLSQKSRTLELSIRINEGMIRRLMKRSVPLFHRYLTGFGRDGLGFIPEKDYRVLRAWHYKLAEALGEELSWTTQNAPCG